MTCAICIADRLCTLQPLGRNNALVPVCRACNSEHPRSGRYSFSSGTRSQTPARATPVRGQS